MKQIVIMNADDLGISNSVNEAIKQLFLMGGISSTTLIVTSPYIDLLDVGFYSELARSGKVGLHLDFREFQPLSKSLYYTDLCNDHGFFEDIRNIRVPFWKKVLYLAEIRKEIDSQILKFEKILGCKPSHLDSHGHTHTNPIIFTAILLSKKARAIGRMRRSREYIVAAERSSGYLKKFGKNIFNIVLTFFFASTDKFIGIRLSPGRHLLESEVLNSIKGSRVIEVMCHPSMEVGTDQYEEYKWLCANPYTEHSDTVFISYSDIKR